MEEHGRGANSFSVLKDPARFTPEEAEVELERLRVVLAELRRGLADRNVTDGLGRKLSPEEYRWWRRDQRTRLADKEAEYIRLRGWVKHGALSNGS